MQTANQVSASIYLQGYKGPQKSMSGKFHNHLGALWLKGLRTQHSVSEDVGLIPDLAEWVKDLGLLQAVEQVADAACIPSHCGWGIGLSCSSNSTPGLGTSRCLRCSHKRKKNNGSRIPRVGAVCWKRAILLAPATDWSRADENQY